MMATIFEICINFIETVIIFDFITRYLECKYDDIRKYIGFIGACLLSYSVLSLMNYVTVFEGLGTFIYILIDFLYALIFLKGSISLKIWISLLVEMLTMFIGIAASLALSQYMGYDSANMVTEFNVVRVTCVILTKVALFIITRLILKYKYKSRISSRMWILIISIPTISVFSLSMLMLAALCYNEISKYIICGMAGILAANIITFYFFSIMSKDYETKMKLKLLEQNNENIEKSLKDANAFVKKTENLKHNLNNQLLIMSDYLQKEEYDAARRHIEKLTQEHIPFYQDLIHSENEAFNAVVNSKINVCNDKKIYIEIKEKDSALRDLDSVDIGVLFGNLLDNAIEAAEKSKSKRIIVDIGTENDYLSIMVMNSISSSVMSENKTLETTKKNKEVHGFGIRSIRRVVNKYNGMIQFYEKDDMFYCHIMLLDI